MHAAVLSSTQGRRPVRPLCDALMRHGQSIRGNENHIGPKACKKHVNFMKSGGICKSRGEITAKIGEN